MSFIGDQASKEIVEEDEDEDGRYRSNVEMYTLRKHGISTMRGGTTTQAQESHQAVHQR